MGETKKVLKTWYYEDVYQLFNDNGLIPTFEKVEDRYRLKDKLTATDDKGYKFITCIDRLKYGRKPDAFSRYNPFTIENIKKYLNVHESGYELLSDVYKNNYTKLLWKCEVNHCFEMSWGDFQQGKRCAKCSKVYKRTNEDFLQDVLSLVGNEYTFLEEFEHVDKKIEVIHNECNYKYKVSPYKFINRGQRCPNCFGTPKKTDAEFKDEVRSLVGTEYIILGKYETAHDEILIKHKDCGNEYMVTPHAFLSKGTRCPKCIESKGEKKIDELLKTWGIDYKSQFTFKDCKNIHPLRFDFAIFNSSKKVTCLIEFDGRQHYEPVDYFGGIEGFEKTRFNDSIKNNYCKKNNIKLLRIPYTEHDNIEKILTTHL